MEREKELEAFLVELESHHKEEEEEREEGRVVPRKALELQDGNSPSQRDDGEQEAERKVEDKVSVMTRKEGVEERVREVRKEQERRYPIGRKGIDENRVVEPGVVKEEAVQREQNQRRLFSQRPNNGRLRDQDRGRVRRAPLSNEEGFPHFPVDLGTFDPEAYLGGQLLEEGENEMKKFQFNQRRSQETPYDRELKDVRNPRYRFMNNLIIVDFSLFLSLSIQLCQLQGRLRERSSCNQCHHLFS